MPRAKKKVGKRMNEPEQLPKAFRAELLNLLAEQVLRYNGGESSSVRVETAERIFESILYCIRADLESRRAGPDSEAEFSLGANFPPKAEPTPGTVPPPKAELTPEGGPSPRELYRRGLALVKEEVSRAKALYRQVLKTRVRTGLLAYNVTLDGALPGFFKTYDPDYAAQENGALTGSPDYPLLCSVGGGGGIVYMKAYLEELLRENKFCARYSANHIRALLFVHGQKHGLDYREVIVNIPELILAHENAPKPYRIS